MTKIDRATIISKIDASTDYDAATIRIHRDGTISAKRDANKTFAGHDPMRYLVGHVSDFAADA